MQQSRSGRAEKMCPAQSLILSQQHLINSAQPISLKHFVTLSCNVSLVTTCSLFPSGCSATSCMNHFSTRSMGAAHITLFGLFTLEYSVKDTLQIICLSPSVQLEEWHGRRISIFRDKTFLWRPTRFKISEVSALQHAPNSRQTTQGTKSLTYRSKQ